MRTVSMISLKKIKLKTLDHIIENRGKLHFNMFKLL